MNYIYDYKGEERAFMKRALQLSLCGGSAVSPNPFVGAVIVARGRIIGEGYHRRFGGPHAEANAIASVMEADHHLLAEASMYVTLEPCSHFGKTPPCADLIIRTGIPRVYVAAEDPFLKDKASGIDKMREHGIEVHTGLLKDEALFVNRRFFTAHTLKRPYIMLKWAQSADGFIAREGGTPVKLSSDFTQLLVHRERAFYDAILVGPNTMLCDNPRLNCRLWPTRNPEERPLKTTFDSDSLKGNSVLEKGVLIKKPKEMPLRDYMAYLYAKHSVSSLMVEGGRATLESFLAERLYDEIRIETTDLLLHNGIEAPDVSKYLHSCEIICTTTETFSDNKITKFFVKNP